MDDILTATQYIRQAEEVLSICRKRNMKISPSKFQVGSIVTYGGIVIEAVQHEDDDKKTVFLSPTQEKLDAFLDFQEGHPVNLWSCGPAETLDAWVDDREPLPSETVCCKCPLLLEQ